VAMAALQMAVVAVVLELETAAPALIIMLVAAELAALALPMGGKEFRV